MYNAPLPLAPLVSPDNEFKAINMVLHALTPVPGLGGANQGQKCWESVETRVNPGAPFPPEPQCGSE